MKSITENFFKPSISGMSLIAVLVMSSVQVEAIEFWYDSEGNPSLVKDAKTGNMRYPTHNELAAFKQAELRKTAAKIAALEQEKMKQETLLTKQKDLQLLQSNMSVDQQSSTPFVLNPVLTNNQSPNSTPFFRFYTGENTVFPNNFGLDAFEFSRECDFSLFGSNGYYLEPTQVRFASNGVILSFSTFGSFGLRHFNRHRYRSSRRFSNVNSFNRFKTFGNRNFSRRFNQRNLKNLRVLSRARSVTFR